MVDDKFMTLWMDMDIHAWKTLQEYYTSNKGFERKDLLEEITRLRGKVSFYESRLIDMYSQVKK